MTELIDWGLARSVATAAAGSAEVPEPPVSLDESVARSERAVRGYTGLKPEIPVPIGEWIGRAEWAEVAVASMRDSSRPLERKLLEAAPSAGPLGSVASGVLGRLLAIQLGAVIGLASRRVLGQYEFPVLGPEREPRLLFVGPNIAEATESLDGEPGTVLDWIALHEVTHAVHFGATPWLRGHLGALAEELISSSGLAPDPGEIANAAKRLFSTDPRRLLEELRESDPLTLLTPPRSRYLLDSTQAAMASIEGYAEHVMDAAAPRVGAEVAGLRESMEQRRQNRPPLARLLSWLLGMELKMRQYRDGKQFCDAVVDAAGIEGLNRAWERAGLLPEIEELGEPRAWIDRVEKAP